MRHGVEHHVAHSRDELAESRCAARIDAQHERIDEESDQSFRLHPRTAGDGRPDDEIVRAGVAAEEKLEHREQHDEGRDPRLAREGRHRVARGGPQANGRACRRARPIGIARCLGGQVKGG